MNKDLADVLGNFVNRVLKFSASRFESRVPDGGAPGPREAALVAELAERISAYQRHLDAVSFRKAMAELRAIWAAGNVYLADVEPWKLVESDRPRAAAIVRTAIDLVRLFAVLSEPVMPETCARVFDALALPAHERRWPESIEAELRTLGAGRPID